MLLINKHTKTQCEKILEVLEEEEYVPVYRFVEMGIMQYNARIYQLREKGYRIRNIKRTQDGKVHSIYTLIPDPREELKEPWWETSKLDEQQGN